MDKKMKYSIIYGVIRSEISEQISLGIIFVGDEGIRIRYSEKKLNVLKQLYSANEYHFVEKVIKSFGNNPAVNSENAINYLARYSNNLIKISQPQNIDLPSSPTNEEWLYRNYVYDGARI